MVIYFTRYDCEKAIRMLGPYCDELTKKKMDDGWWMIDDYMPDKVLDRI